METQLIDPDQLPENVQSILNSFDEDRDGYAECKRIVTELEAVGYTAEYGLDAELYNLRKL